MHVSAMVSPVVRGSWFVSAEAVVVLHPPPSLVYALEMIGIPFPVSFCLYMCMCGMGFFFPLFINAFFSAALLAPFLSFTQYKSFSLYSPFFSGGMRRLRARMTWIQRFPSVVSQGTLTRFLLTYTYTDCIIFLFTTLRAASL